MGSSPVTATIGPSTEHLLQRLRDFLRRELPSLRLSARGQASPSSTAVESPPCLLVAFSGGPDSLALLWGLRTLAQPRQTPDGEGPSEGAAADLAFTVEAAHFDHAQDSGSSDRAEAAGRLAAALEVPLWSERAANSPPLQGSAHQGQEGEARRLRYEFLRRIAENRNAAAILTAHHADDQVETVCLRLLFGSGIAGLAAMRPRQDDILRPLLDIRRSRLEEVLRELTLTATEDPTNRHLVYRRNLVRRRLLPALPVGSDVQLLRLADAADRARSTVERVLERLLPWSPHAEPTTSRSYPLEVLSQLPAPLLSWAMARLHRVEGHDYPPPLGAVRELQEQLDRRRRMMDAETPYRPLRCSAGSDLLWEERQGALHLVRLVAPTPSFSIAAIWPQTVELPDLGYTLRIDREPVADWMFLGDPRRTALSPDIGVGTTYTVRNRLPGDRLHPIGGRSSKRLKDLFIDLKIPAAERDRIPLLCVEDSIVWVPGVTIDDEFKLLPRHREAWVASLTTRQAN